jgi:non-homologous end joining protein Ku
VAFAKAATGLQPARLEPCCYPHIWYNRIFAFLQLPEYNGSVRRCRTMKEQKYHIYLTEQERSEVIKSLIDLKNALIRQGKYTDAVDDLLVKLTGAKRKKLKVVYI